MQELKKHPLPLMRFVVELLDEEKRGRSLQDVFSKDPAGLMARYHLTPEQQEVMLSQNVDRIAPLLGEEMRMFQYRPLNEQPPWPAPGRHVISRCRKTSEEGQTIGIEVDGFASDPLPDPKDIQLALVPDGQQVKFDGAQIDGVVSKEDHYSSGWQRLKWRIKARVTLPAGAPKGSYGVLVSFGRGSWLEEHLLQVT